MKKTISIPEYKELCKQLDKARQDAGLHQSDLARKLRKPQSFISRVEAGQRRLDIVEFLAYTRALNLDPYQLLHSFEEQCQTNRSKKSSARKKASSEKKNKQ